MLDDDFIADYIANQEDSAMNFKNILLNFNHNLRLRYMNQITMSKINQFNNLYNKIIITMHHKIYHKTYLNSLKLDNMILINNWFRIMKML